MDHILSKRLILIGFDGNGNAVLAVYIYLCECCGSMTSSFTVLRHFKFLTSTVIT